MKPPKNGCVCREAVRHHGYIPISHGDERERRAIRTVVETGLRLTTPVNVMALFDPVCPAKGEEVMGSTDHLPMRPPFDSMWLETVDLDGTPLGFAVHSNTHFKNDKWVLVSIVAFALTTGKCPHAVAAMAYTVDEAGRRRDPTAVAPIYGDPSDEINQLRQARVIYPCLRMLQRVNLTNIGLYEEQDPDESNPRLTRSQRRKFIGRRYHVMVIRHQRDMKANRKIVDYKGTAPLHWARGHFQHYGPASVHRHPDGRDRGLAFGWLAGVFWIEATRKGKAANGIVDKDYKFADPAAPRRKRRPRTAEQSTNPDSFADVVNPINRDIAAPQCQEVRQ